LEYFRNIYFSIKQIIFAFIFLQILADHGTARRNHLNNPGIASRPLMICPGLKDFLQGQASISVMSTRCIKSSRLVCSAGGRKD
jgi:hypothetical protein